VKRRRQHQQAEGGGEHYSRSAQHQLSLVGDLLKAGLEVRTQQKSKQYLTAEKQNSASFSPFSILFLAQPCYCMAFPGSFKACAIKSTKVDAFLPEQCL
jgi:hypothetical protein